ncbi:MULTISPECIES: TRAP transporter small permease [Gallibacterium]|uniref:TRAP transporter small permease protein n=2 Tax=Gallibacterium TaxID=155493 RepID=A0A377H437_9PAST|nr:MULTISPECIES: TRAP transporter small permease [Gallibacterium]KGQ27096.1 C4-dicarboxylate ABC transporter substrate-binding protein [Gallibacterium anatis]KGQ33176.1 C4-dicarboxylate ABC transporter substrate-binding protein [Gallibacterium anatis]KGQ37019.1 C4-dicarboxylate ABC transporter substrate-binding protein [Gallibacterium genomosp. 1]KGQ41191.1 C4-dicarboxylate ABC transporter substrate-binding protein [Gallibacterium anatis IPDH697-78]KGQ52361.1 C4-dicarboxylate ABC transporter s
MNQQPQQKKFWLSDIDEILASFFLALIVLLSGYGVIMRYFLNSPSAWVEEMCVVFFIWFTFLASSALCKNNELIRIDFLLSKLPHKIANFIDGVIQPCIMIFALVFMIYLGFKLLPMSKVRFTPTLHISYLAIYAIIPISACFMLYYEIRKIVYYFRINHRSKL